MNWDDETLGAFLDGEADARTMTQIEAALLQDDALQARIERLRAVRRALGERFNPVLSEDLPEHLVSLVRSSAAPSRPARPAASGGFAARCLAWFTAHGVPVAAALLIGVGTGVVMAPGAQDSDVGLARGEMVLEGRLASLLDRPGPGDQAGAATQIAFMHTDGRYCRTFTLADTAGIACRTDAVWQVEHTAPARSFDDNTVRTAASALPLDVLDRVDAWISGDPLDREQETEAAARGWQAGPD